MVILISGASHTGKTLLAKKLVKRHSYACISQDLLKMGLIRSGNTDITAYDTERLRPYLWNITAEIVKTAIENDQDLIVEGCYIPANYRDKFEKKYLEQIKFICLAMSENFLRKHFDEVCAHSDDAERRTDDAPDLEKLVQCNNYFISRCKECGANYLLIDDEYKVDWDIQ